MEKLVEFYAELGVSPAVYEYGEKAIASLRERFEAIDKIAEYNQAKVLSAFRKNRVSATCLAVRSTTSPAWGIPTSSPRRARALITFCSPPAIF